MSNFNSKRPYELPSASVADGLRAKLGPSFKADNFTKFTWRGQNSWDIYYCFIINNGSDLKWTGAGSITNNYSNSMYETNKTLLGISTKTKSKSLKLGLFAITEEEYRKFLYWMDPMAIDQLMFDYDEEYYYYAKLSSVGDAIKYIIGKNEQGKELYYAELDVKFDLQGDGYAYSRSPIEWKLIDNSTDTYHIPNNTEENIKVSDVRVPFIIKILNNQNGIHQNIKATITNGVSQPIELFNLQLQQTLDNNNYNEIVYESGSGVLLSAKDKLLSYLSRGDNGEKLFNSFSVNKFLLPSKYEDGIDLDELANVNISVIIDDGQSSIPPASVLIYHYNKTLVL